MLFSPERHEPLRADAWDEARAREAIERIVRDTESRFTPEGLWPMHPGDAPDPAPQYLLYWGASGVIWALHHLQDRGAARLARDYAPVVPGLIAANRAAMGRPADAGFAAYLMGDTGIRLLEHRLQPSAAIADELARLCGGHLGDPTLELMWGTPGTMLAALFMHERTGEQRWAHIYRDTARRLWSQLEWSEDFGCHFWTQQLYGQRSTYIDAVHGFVATAVPLIHGRHLLDDAEWNAWRDCIANTVQRTADREGAQANWRPRLFPLPDASRPKLVQMCHGAPGFVICLADFPGDTLDELLLAAGETTWQAGPLNKGANLCHGTGGNGYAFLKLHRRFGDAAWLDRARAFAMHGIAQTEADLAAHGHRRYSLWTGDPGFAIYLWDCIEGTDRFPTLDCFF
ncbi:Lanthionine synthetase C-like protein [Variovorax sp. PDC80]|uniref:lanthionine synthetase C family protein n=1 Tax=Variovorax sp. PDC80 TaxID=1882827 RepID=UPI0008DF291E|nr:LanC-like protein [Variovorax sp. PDC80]SFO38831.1 Lanthionine synthetase C-like protein [Variovorax sp. PDC80]